MQISQFDPLKSTFCELLHARGVFAQLMSRVFLNRKTPSINFLTILLLKINARFYITYIDTY